MTQHDPTAAQRGTYSYDPSPAPAYAFAPQGGSGSAPEHEAATTPAGDPPEAVEANNPVIHLVASFFVPGLGSYLNGDTQRGLVIFAAYLASWIGYALLVWILVGFLFLPVAAAIWVFGMYDAYRGAESWNTRHGVEV